MKSVSKQNALFLAFTIALIATLGSLFLSIVLHWVPCVLCWYQRVMLFPLVIILGVATVKKISNLEYIVFPMTFIGMLVAIYHNLLQYHIIPEGLAPCSVGASCLTLYHFWFNFLTVPLLSLISFIAITVCMVIYRKAQNE
jgi:disulfide bond formation protein DsbB